MEKFKKFFIWEVANEFYASIYSLSIIGCYCIFALIDNKRTVDIFMIIETLFVGYAIAIIQNIIFVGKKRFTKKESRIRCILWHIASNGICLLSAILFNWFGEFPRWTLIVYVIFTIIMFVATWYWISLNKSIDSENLNEMLNVYKSKIKLDKED